MALFRRINKTKSYILKKYRKSSVIFYPPLFLITRLIALNIYTKSKSSIFIRVRVFLLIILLVAVIVTSTITIFYYKNSFDGVLDVCAYTSTACCAIVSYLCIHIFYRKKLQKLLNGIQSSYNLLYHKFRFISPGSRSLFYFYFYSIVCLYCGYIMFDLITEKGVQNYMDYVLYFATLTNFTVALQFSCIEFAIQNICSTLNKNLKNWKNLLGICDKATTKNNPHIFLNFSLTTTFFLEEYNKVFDLIEVVEECYGLSIAYFCMFLMCLIVKLLAYITLLDFMLNNALTGVTALAASAAACTITIHLISMACTKVKEEIKHTSLILFDMVLELPFPEETSTTRNLEQDILMLSLIVLNRSARFSAAGLFDVDFSVMFMILSSISYFVLILLQLR